MLSANTSYWEAPGCALSQVYLSSFYRFYRLPASKLLGQRFCGASPKLGFIRFTSIHAQSMGPVSYSDSNPKMEMRLLSWPERNRSSIIGLWLWPHDKPSLQESNVWHKVLHGLCLVKMYLDALYQIYCTRACEEVKTAGTRGCGHPSFKRFV